MKKNVLKTVSFFVSLINPGQLNLVYKILSRFSPFKKSIYVIVKFIIPEKIRLENYDFFLNQQDAMVSGALALNVYENFEVEVFTQALQPEMTVIDIGANIGYYTLLAANRAKSVLAFEPDAANYALLMKNITQNQCQNVVAHKLAIADKAGELFLFENPDNFGDRRIYSFDDASSKAKVSTVALDDFLQKINLPPVDFIKIDIQGAEGYALAGMQKTLNQAHLQLLMEFFPAGLRDSGFEPVEILKTLRDKQFEIYDVNGRARQLVPVVDFEAFVKKFKTTDYTNLYCKK